MPKIVFGTIIIGPYSVTLTIDLPWNQLAALVSREMRSLVVWTGIGKGQLGRPRLV